MRQLKKELKKAFEAPQPQRKEEFLRQHGNGGGSLTGFLMVQLSYIGKGCSLTRLWLIQIFLF